MVEKLVKLPEKGLAVFVGDTHGDLEASKKVVKKFLKKGVIVFLGDYIDRGHKSRENVDFLLKCKKKRKNIILLLGNHEAYSIIPCFPADFWNSLKQEEYIFYSAEFLKLPLAVYSENGLIALHGALPEIKNILEINKIEYSVRDKNFSRILWGDFTESEKEEQDIFTGRIKFNNKYFDRIIEQLNMNVLIRSHDPHAKERMFNGRCITIFTSYAYGTERKVALVPLDKKLITPEDIKIESLD